MGFGGLLNQLATTTAGGGMGAVVENYPVASGYSVSAGDVVDVNESGELKTSVLPVSNIENEIFKANAIDTAVVKLNDQYSIAVFAGSSAEKGGQTVLINNSDGKAASMNWPAISSSGISNVSLARLSDTRFVVSWRNGGSHYAKLGAVSETSITYGAQTNWASSSYGSVLVPLSDTSVIGFSSINNNLNARILNVSSTSLSMGASAQKSGLLANKISATRLPDDSNGNKRAFVCLQDDNDSGKNKAVIVNISSSNVITFGDATTFDGFSSAKTSCCTYNDGVILAYCYYASSASETRVCARAISISGNSITAGDECIIKTSSGSSSFDVSAQKASESIVVLAGMSQTGNAFVLTKSGETLGLAGEFEFNSSYSPYLSSSMIDDKRVIVAYADNANSGYGTTTILEVKGTQIAGSFITNSTQAIALQSGTAGQTIPVCYSGIVKAPFVSQGDVISSSGVTGVGILDGVLQVYAKDAPGKIVTGSYVGNGKYGTNNKNILTFDARPVLLFITGVTGALYVNLSEYLDGVAVGAVGVSNFNTSSINLNRPLFYVNGNSVSWYSPDSVNAQCNESGYEYYYTAIF